MIKVNMLRNLGLQQAGGGSIAGYGGGAADESYVSPEAKKKAILKIIVILIFPIALFAFQKINISALEKQVAGVQSQVDGLNAEKASFGTVAPRVDKYTKEKKDIEKQVEGIRELTKNRLREVKTLDLLQSLVPDQTWLTQIDLSSGVVKLEGFTSDDNNGVGKLVKALEGSVLFSQVIPKSTTRVDLPSGPAKKFEIEFKVGKSE